MTTAIRRAGRGLGLTATFGVLAVLATACGSSTPATARTDANGLPLLRAGSEIQVSSIADGPKIPDGFLGLSTEYHSLKAYAGADSARPNPTFLQLLRNLAPHGTPVLRMGGDSTDWTWWPVPGMRRPGGVTFALTPHYASTLRSIARDVHGKLLLGINFEADSRRVAAYEERQLAAHVGMAQIDAFELGNEPELYHKYAWYKTPTGTRVLGRGPDYTVQAFIRDYAGIAAGLPSEPLAGPESTSTNWLNLPAFLDRQPRGLSMVTVHTYALKDCSPEAHPTVGELFEPSSLQQLANEVGGWVETAGARHLPLRIDEMNSVTCGGYLPVTGSIASALWALNILPLYAKAGAVGVNFHMVPGDQQALIAPIPKGGGQLTVEPEYYALLAFAQLAPAGSQLLRTSAPPGSGMLEWADRTPAGNENVVVTNPSSSGGNIKVSVPSQSVSGKVTLLRGNGGLRGRDGIRLGGQRLSTKTGELTGTATSTTVKPSGHTYEVSVPAAGAAILSFAAPQFQPLGTTAPSG